MVEYCRNVYEKKMDKLEHKICIQWKHYQIYFINFTVHKESIFGFGGRLIFYGINSKPDNDRHYAKNGVEDRFFV